MESYQYMGFGQRVYRFFLPDDQDLIVNPGDIRELEKAPADGCWILAEDSPAPAKPAPKKETK